MAVNLRMQTLIQGNTVYIPTVILLSCCVQHAANTRNICVAPEENEQMLYHFLQLRCTCTATLHHTDDHLTHGLRGCSHHMCHEHMADNTDQGLSISFLAGSDKEG